MHLKKVRHMGIPSSRQALVQEEKQENEETQLINTYKQQHET